jgi:DNA-binding HxlR family transcriptional regulator
MHIINNFRDQLNARTDAEIINCLRVHGLMRESELQSRTAIKTTKLQSRLERLAKLGFVSFDVDLSCWRIYHGSKQWAA